ncbi:MAG: glycogen synthase GlgA [Deltaproteobacteria bacterium]|nr:glycogen synthase GlgA [Deltaproteobacteria bacterium]
MTEGGTADGTGLSPIFGLDRTFARERGEMKVLFATSEVSPLATAGGLGDVMGSLPMALAGLGCEISVVIPAYRSALERLEEWNVAARDLPLTMGKRDLTVEILRGELDMDLPVYLVRRDEYFDREGIYGTERGEYFDNPERFIFFSRAIPPLCSALSLGPDIVLANDWETGLVMALMDQGAIPGASGVFAIHNMGYHGLVPAEAVEKLGLADRYLGMEGLEFYGSMSLLKAGIVYARRVVTVSPTYALEIQTPEFGFGLDGLIRSVSGRLHGILNGADYRVWNPETDEYIVSSYSPRDPGGKALCKEDLLRAMGLDPGLMKRPLAGMVTRLVEQKGCRLVAEAADRLFEMGMGLVVLGSGEKVYEEMFLGLQSRYPDRFALRLGFDTGLAHRIVAGSDLFLVPSLYEPCGLTQIYSLKYGTVPVVRATGGLKDTVIDPREKEDLPTGFKFHPFRAEALVEGVTRAVRTYGQPRLWQEMMLRGMNEDFSWDRSAREYLRLFEMTVSG